MTPDPKTTKKAFWIEMIRSGPIGMLEFLFVPLAGLVALKYYNASDWQKAFLLSISEAGLIATFIIVPLIRRLKWQATHAAAIFSLLGAAGIAFTAAYSDSLISYMAGLGFAFFILMLPLPLITQIYRTNFPEARRGKILAIASILRGIIGIAFAWKAGQWIDSDIENFKPLLWVFVCVSLLNAIAFWLMPKVETAKGSTNPFSAFKWLKRDKKFRTLIISWMLMGLGNLTALKIWTEYFANDQYGNGFSAFEVTLLTFIIPQSVKILFTYPWGWLFDRMNFYLLRIILNVLFGAAIIVVFYGQTFWVIAIGTGLQGLAFAGGSIAWMLWVTKIAPPEHTAEYMSIHTFTTGLRGVIAPALGFYLLVTIGDSIAIFSTILIILASVVIIPEYRRSRGSTNI
ncbi:MFS transporter [Verrucomicrobia bacterium]|nr:MFS transporter [Verrucomicrobiota bacterium]